VATEQNIGVESSEFNTSLSFNSQYNSPYIAVKSQNDYSIPNLETYNVLIFTGSTDIDLKGLDSSGLTEWSAFLIYNGNTNGKKVKLKKNQGSSLAENRFLSDVEIEAGEFAWVLYDQDRQRFAGQSKH
jgi:hypothetical protein